MGDISNKSLAALLVVAIVVSVAGTWLVVNQGPGLVKTTGAVAGTGTANMTISTTTSIKFSDALMAWGAVKVNTTGGYTDCYLDTSVASSNGTGCFSGYTADTTGLQIENDGNVNLNVTLKSDVTTDTFVTGTNDYYKFMVSEVGGSCLDEVAAPAAYTDVITTDTVICNKFGYLTGADQLDVDLTVKVPYDATAGLKTSVWTATGTAV